MIRLTYSPLWQNAWGEQILGLLPHFLREDDVRSASAQFNERYQHGGGWRPLEGWIMNPKTFFIRYTGEEPGDEGYMPVAVGKLHDETIVFYEDAWVAIVKPDGSFEVARLD